MAGGGGGGPPRRPLCLAEVEAGSENERLGVARDSMLRNPLILKIHLQNCIGDSLTHSSYFHKRYQLSLQTSTEQNRKSWDPFWP